jgi:dienelactone hydrolase
MERSIQRDFDGMPSVTIDEPRTRTPAGLTFVVGAANMPVSKYVSIKNVLLKMDHVVVRLFVNVARPIRNNHRTKADNIHCIFKELKTEYRVERYNIVGHSIGGKIALLVAALHNKDHSLRAIVALDPCDQSPTEFTNKAKGAKNLDLMSSDVDISLTHTGSGFFIKKEHSAEVIQRYNRSKFKLVKHFGAAHMAYCDEEEGKMSWKGLMDMVEKVNDDKDPEKDKFAKKDALELISVKCNSNVAQKASRKIKKSTKGVMKEVTGIFSDMEDDAKGISKSFTTKMAAANFMSKLK